MSPDDPRHGTTAGYHQRCRCEPCRAAMSRYEKITKHNRHVGRQRRRDALGAQRRIQALMAIGWTTQDIAEAAGWGHRNAVLRILHGQKGKPCTWLEAATDDTIRAVYDKLHMSPPEMNSYRKRARTIALRKGYVPPLAWDDIDRDPAPATVTKMRHRSSDLLAEYEHLIACGESHEQALKQLGVAADAIHTARARTRKEVA